MQSQLLGQLDLIPRINSIHLILEGIVIVILLVWGGYGILLTQTSPSDQRSIITEALAGEYAISSTGTSGGGVVITPGSEFQYILMFQGVGPTTGTRNSSAFALPAGGYAFGPITWTPSSNTLSSFPNSTSYSYKIAYAVFTFSFNYPAGPLGCCRVWFSGPNGNISQYLGTVTYGGLDNYAKNTGGGLAWSTAMFDVDAPGNYSLHFAYAGTLGNATGRVSMGPSLVYFLRTQPYLYPGVATVVAAIILAIVGTLVAKRKPSSTVL